MTDLETFTTILDGMGIEYARLPSADRLVVFGVWGDTGVWVAMAYPDGTMEEYVAVSGK